MLNLLLAIFMSISFRSANQENCKTDYEIKGGFETDYSYISLLTERENGEKYFGADLQGYYKWFKIKYYRKEAQGISNQTISLRYPEKGHKGRYCGQEYSKQYFKGYFIGAINWIDWREEKLLAGVGIDCKLLNLEWLTNARDRNIFTFRLGKKIQINLSKPLSFKSFKKGVYIEPTFIYKLYDDKKFWQYKISIGWKK